MECGLQAVKKGFRHKMAHYCQYYEGRLVRHCTEPYPILLAAYNTNEISYYKRFLVVEYHTLYLVGMLSDVILIDHSSTIIKLIKECALDNKITGY
jgi:hypothetical protein